MIHVKINTLNKAVLQATARYFDDLARSTGEYFGELAQAEAHELGYSPAPALVEEIEEIEEIEETQTLDLPPPPPTGGTAATVHALAAAGVELDADGYPWDHRIHAETKTKIADGTWKKKRGVDPERVAEIREEFKRTAAIPIGIAPIVDLAPAAIPPAPAAAVPDVPPAPAPLAETVIAPVPAAAEKPSNPALLFASTMALYAKCESAGKVGKGAGDQWAKAAGLPGLSALITRPDLCGQFYDQLAGLIA